MRKLIAITLLILVFSCSTAVAAENSLISHQIKKLYASPSEKAKLVYEFPVEVTLLDISPNADWYKVKVSFYIGPFNYVYTGWTKIPIGTTLAKREQTAKEALSSVKK